MAKIKNKELNYLVPFFYKNDYDSFFRDFNYDNWVLEKDSKNGDLCPHIRKEYLNEDNSFGTTLNKKNSFSLVYIKNKDNNENSYLYDEIRVNNVKLILFRNNVGIFKYSIEAKNIQNTNVLIDFQDIIKELNRRESLLFISNGKDSTNNTVNYKSFSFGNWIASELYSISISAEFTPSMKNAYASLAHYYGIKFLNDNNSDSKPLFKIEEKDDQSNTLDKQMNSVPDKALCFSYCALDDSENLITDNDLKDLSFHIANGYSNKYKYTQDSDVKYLKTFENVIWCSSFSGCACVTYSNENNAFVTTDYKERVNHDYLHLYIKAIFESYSLLKYSIDISSLTSSNYRDYLNGKEYDNLLDLHTKINLFLCKDTSTFVSYISHQNSFYDYLKETLKINESIETVSSGLDSLNELQKEIKDSRVETGLNVLTIIQGIFVASSIFDLLGLFILSDNKPNNIVELYDNYLPLFIIFVILFVAIILIEIKIITYIIKARNRNNNS